MNSNEDLCIRFSNTVYATKHEVSKALNINSIDEVWDKIVRYRSSFNKTLLVRNIERTPYNVTLTPSISNKLNNIERRLMKCILKFSRFDDEENKTLLRKECYVKCLYWVAKKYNISVTEEFLNSLVEGNLSTISPSERILVNYYRILRYVETHYFDPINHDFMIDIYSMLTGAEQIDSPYRTTSLEGFTTAIPVNEAPVERIIPLMEELFEFLQKDDVSPLVKAITAYYFVTHIKPFDVYSEEIALILMKNILAHNDFDEVATLLDLEQLLSDNEETLNGILDEVLKTNDITYLVDYVLPLIETMTDNLLNQITTVSTKNIRDEYYDKPLSSSVRSKERILPPVDINEPLSSNASSQVMFEMNVSLPTLPVGLDEKDAAKIEEHLLEVYPTLKRGQAYFYARHCTIGKYYTISQYKKLLGVAYETARTSMDNLTELGFYRKEKLNNKFIYTPLPRR